jgi:galactosylceramidase
VLATVQLPNIGSNQWHNLKIRFEGSTITGLVDGKPILTATDSLYFRGMAGLYAGGDTAKLSMPYFDNVLINRPNAPAPSPSTPLPTQLPIYKPLPAAR